VNRLVLILTLATLIGGCKQLGLAPHETDPNAVKVDPTERAEPFRVTVQHVLIAYEGSKIPGVTRSLEKAERVAFNVFEAAVAGQDFDELVGLYSDDGGDGRMNIVNWGVSRTEPEDMERARLVRGFSRAAFTLDVGKIGFVPFDAGGSPYGWHVIRRLE
jgi:parvulin-like peptidyl-prolyl cis-trans isomerase-like protein